jgi:hypothetical protein
MIKRTFQAEFARHHEGQDAPFVLYISSAVCHRTVASQAVSNQAPKGDPAAWRARTCTQLLQNEESDSPLELPERILRQRLEVLYDLQNRRNSYKSA